MIVNFRYLFLISLPVIELLFGGPLENVDGQVIIAIRLFANRHRYLLLKRGILVGIADTYFVILCIHFGISRGRIVHGLPFHQRHMLILILKRVLVG